MEEKLRLSDIFSCLHRVFGCRHGLGVPVIVTEWRKPQKGHGRIAKAIFFHHESHFESRRHQGAVQFLEDGLNRRVENFSGVLKREVPHHEYRREDCEKETEKRNGRNDVSFLFLAVPICCSRPKERDEPADIRWQHNSSRNPQADLAQSALVFLDARCEQTPCCKWQGTQFSGTALFQPYLGVRRPAVAKTCFSSFRVVNEKIDGLLRGIDQLYLSIGNGSTRGAVAAAVIVRPDLHVDIPIYLALLKRFLRSAVRILFLS